jgi:hypothetical protein
LKKPSSFKGFEVVLEMQSVLHWNFLLQDWKKASSLNGVEIVPESVIFSALEFAPTRLEKSLLPLLLERTFSRRSF